MKPDEKKKIENIRTQGTVSKSELATFYGFSLKTLSRKLKAIPGLEDTGKRRLLMPKEHELIFNHLGTPKRWIKVVDEPE